MAASGDPQYALARTDTLFEAPNSAEVHPISGKDRKFYSIDFSLELERQLEMENTPVTPSFPLPSASHGETPPAAGADIQSEKVDASLDPAILAHIVTQLRSSLVEMTKERDELSRLLSESLNKEANLNDALQLMTEKATATNEELDVAKRKAREDEEAIALLRAKVEESRRGLMQLQKESRRQSMAPIDVNRASLLNAFAPGSSSNPPPNKRASTFTPLTGRSNSHRRISSVSGVVDFSIDTPNGQTLTFPDGITGTSPPPTTTRSSFMGRQPSPSRPDTLNSPPRDTASAELASLRTQVQNLRAELQSVKHDLAETTEAREASENCVQALRQFIAESSTGEAASSPGGGLPLAMKLPPPPTMTNGSEEGDSLETASVKSLESKKAAGGWGFKLWGSNNASVDSPKPPASAAVPPQSAPAWGSPQLGNSTPTIPPASATQPLSKKLGGFFSSRSASISSTSTSSSVGGSALSGLPPLDTIHQGSSSHPNPNAAPSHSLMMARHISTETASSVASDASSLSGSYVEPLSPGDDIHGLGNGLEYRQAPSVMVRGETDGEIELLEEVDMGKTEGASVPAMSKDIPPVDIGVAR